MHPFTETQFRQLLLNGIKRDRDHPPVALLFLTNTRCFWLVNEVDPDHPDEALALCDLGQGDPELGYISIEEMMLTQSENDFVSLVNLETFKANYPMSIYQTAARRLRRITINQSFLKSIAAELKFH